MKKPNRWHVAIRDQFAAEAKTTDQIWRGMKAADFQHASALPRATLGARLAEMVAAGTLERVDRSTYRLRGAVGAA